MQLTPDDTDGWFKRGNALLRLDRYADALNSYDRMLELDRDSEVGWYNRGIALALLERYRDAIASFDEALRLNPENTEAKEHRDKLQELVRQQPQEAIG